MKSLMIMDYPFKQGNFYVLGDTESETLNLDEQIDEYIFVQRDLQVPFLTEGVLSSLKEILIKEREDKNNFNSFKGTDEEFIGLRDYI